MKELILKFERHINSMLTSKRVKKKLFELNIEIVNLKKDNKVLRAKLERLTNIKS